MKYMGHKEARRCKGSTKIGSVYEDAINNRLHIYLFLRGVSLPDFDDFIERLEAEGVSAGAELRQRRRSANEGMQETDYQKIDRHIEWIMLRKYIIEREEYLLPLAKSLHDTQSEKGRKRARERWGGAEREILDDLIDKLRGPAYEDWTTKEKWDELMGLMDVARLDPKETWNDGNRDESRVDYIGGYLTYKNFRKNKLPSK